MNQIYTLFFVLLLSMTTGISGPINGQAVPSKNSLYTLYPPLNFGGSMVECAASLYWQKPQLPGGATPAGLAGYYIYRDGVMIFYVNSGETLTYYDYSMEFGAYVYTITANYDLTTYGVPGQFGESPPAGPVTLQFNCPVSLPFYEPWDLGTFSFQNWQFIPAQGNWAMNTGQGNPAPAAFFTGSPAVQSYDVTMKSISMPGGLFLCANMYFEFDYKLTDIAAGSTEKLVAEYYMDNTWFPVIELKNEGSTGWVHQKIDISQVCGKRFRIGFKTTGSNSANIESWAIDNIKVGPVCKGPAGCDYTQAGNVVHLSWQPPPCDSLQYVRGYNVYRTNEYGTPPFNKLNPSLIAALEYSDNYPSNISSAHFRYIITDVQADPATNVILCEAPCDTLTVDYLSGIPKLNKTGMQIFMNPASRAIEVRSGSAIESCELFNCLGQRILTIPVEKTMEITIPASELSPGIYLVQVKTGSGKTVGKVSISRKP